MHRFTALAFTLILLTALCLSPTPGHALPTKGEVLKIVRGNALSESGLAVRVTRPLNQVVMEQKVGKGWKPVRVRHLKFARGERSRLLPVTLPPGVQLSRVRLLGYSNSKFPGRFTKGAREFARLDPMTAGGEVRISDGSGIYTSILTSLPDSSTNTTTPEAVESDIWKIVGNQLFFFNQYRGLQVFDLTTPTAPVRTGTLRLAASGDQLYVLNPAGTTLALMGQSNTKERAGLPALFLLRVRDGVPTLVRELPLPGTVCDSRLIGNTVYILSSVWDPPAATEATGEQGRLVLQAIDLSEVESPVVLPELVFPGSQGTLQAVGDYLLIGAGEYSWSGGSQLLHLVHIATADGAPELLKSFPVKGFIEDKFKMGLVNGAAVVVSSYWHLDRMETWVETFPLAGDETRPLAARELKGARNETLHATRFDGDRLYVVTFRQIDPLFVVDLGDPAQPELLGTLEVPGWSSYLEPLGDRLLAVGVEDQLVTISLFDVTDTHAPALLSRVALGKPGSWSWSEATYDEKAVEYVAEEGLLFVPFQTWSEGGKQTAMQVVRVGRDGLIPDRTIPSSYQARRGTAMGNYFVTISGQELIVSDRIGSESADLRISLAWRVDRVVPFGEYLLQFDDGPEEAYGYYWRAPLSLASGDRQAMLRVSRADDPDALIAEIGLGAGRIVATAEQDDRLFVAQLVPEATKTGTTLRTRVLDLSAPPAVTEIATVTHMITVDQNSLQTDGVQGLWVGDDRLSWYLPGRETQWYWWGPGPVFIDQPLAPIPAQSSAAGLESTSVTVVQPSSPDPTHTAAVLCPISLSNTISASPVITVSSSHEVRNPSPARTENGFVFFSYDTATEVDKQLPENALRPYWQPPPTLLHSTLQVVDFRKGAVVVRDPVSIPGELLSVSQADDQGAVLLTTTQDPGEQTKRRVQAAAYDGVTAWQLDQRSLDVPFWAPNVSDGTRLFFARDGESPGVFSVGYNPASGRLQDAGEWRTTATPAGLTVAGRYLLASSYGVLELAEITESEIDSSGPVFATPTNLWLRVARTAISEQGLWLPANDYGVEFLPWSVVPE